MFNQVQIFDPTSVVGKEAIVGFSRPTKLVPNSQAVLLNDPEKTSGLRIHSQLRKDEWELLDREIMEAVRHELRLVNDLKAAGLTKSVGLGTLVSQWSVGSRMSPATVNMTGQSVADRDRLEYDVAGVPVPVILKEFSIGRRQLEAARNGNDDLELSHVNEATRAVAETLESIVLNGVPGLSFNGVSLYGYSNHPGIHTDTATNYGGGAWSDPNNIVPTVAGMVNAANLRKHRGPFTLYVSQTQFNYAALTYYNDGSSDRPLERLQRLGVATVRSVDPEILPDGSGLLVQMTRNVVDWTEAMGVQALEWQSNDAMAVHFKIMSIATVRLKADSNGNVGVYQFTGG